MHGLGHTGNGLIKPLPRLAQSCFQLLRGIKFHINDFRKTTPIGIKEKIFSHFVNDFRWLLLPLSFPITANLLITSPLAESPSALSFNILVESYCPFRLAASGTLGTMLQNMQDPLILRLETILPRHSNCTPL